MRDLELKYLHAVDGNPREYRYGKDTIPQVDAVVVRGPAAWLKAEPIVTAHLTPRQARNLALELLASASRIEDRKAARP